jgi:hypothetical protein
LYRDASTSRLQPARGKTVPFLFSSCIYYFGVKIALNGHVINNKLVDLARFCLVWSPIAIAGPRACMQWHRERATVPPATSNRPLTPGNLPGHGVPAGCQRGGAAKDSSTCSCPSIMPHALMLISPFGVQGVRCDLDTTSVRGSKILDTTSVELSG